MVSMASGCPARSYGFLSLTLFDPGNQARPEQAVQNRALSVQRKARA